MMIGKGVSVKNAQVKASEIAMMVVGLLAGSACYVAARDLLLVVFRKSGAEGLALVAAYFLVIVAIPSFLLVFVSSLPQSWRYRIVNGVLSVFVLIGFQMRPVIRMLDGFVGAVYGVLQVAVALGMGVVALILWRRWRSGVMKNRAADFQVRNTVLDAEPRASAFLRLLALASVPLVFVTLVFSSFITVGFSALFLFLLFQIPRIPVVLIAAGFFAPLLAVWANFVAVRSIVRPEPAKTLSVELASHEHPQIRQLVDGVAADVGTQKADHIILNAEPGFFVTQGRIETMDGVISGRILSLGLPSLKGLTEGELKSVLAHEFAHFSGKDTSYSLFVSPVYRGIGSVVMSLRRNTQGQGTLGAAIFILQLPAIHFLLSFHDYFATIDSMLGRSRELRADWIAARRYGRQPFLSALEKVSVNGPLFAAALSNIDLKQTDELFQTVDSRMNSLVEERAKIVADLRDYTETEFDSHPSFRTRAESLPDSVSPVDQDDRGLEDALSAEERRLSVYTVEKLGLSPVES